MIDLELLFKEKNEIPDWFKTHAIFKDLKKTQKIFPLIGLSNFSVESSLENSNNDQLIRNLCYGINSYISNAIYHFESPPYSNEQQYAKQKNKYAPAVVLLRQLYKQLSRPKPFINQFATKKGLHLQSDIIDVEKQTFARQNESVFKVYAKLKSFLVKNYGYNGLLDLEQMPAFKEYSSNNFNGKLNIVFSSDGIDGAWDILTMSQRGIQSCQSWNGQYKNCTIGSVIDPFTAIIYLTSGSKTQYGAKMIRRCIVRFVVDKFVKQPCIFLEYMYPSEHAATMKAFKDAIRSKIGDKFPIVDQHTSTNRYYVPYSDATKFLLQHSNQSYVNMRGHHNYYGIFPYRDTFIEYKIKTEATSLEKAIDEEKSALVAKLLNVLQSKTDISDNYISVIKDTIMTEIFEKIKSQECTDTKHYLRRLCINYFANKNSITNAIQAKIIETMKALKDKSIFLPGMDEAPKLPAKKGKATLKTKVVEATIGKLKKTAKLKPAAKATENIKTTIDTQVMPVVTDVFRETWKGVSGGKTVKKKAKAVKVRRL